nr:amidohydrolase family protein [Paenibacillus bovis]
MDNKYIIKAKKIVTVSEQGSIKDGSMLIHNGIIAEISKWEDIRIKYPEIDVIDYSNFIITPGLVECHTHLLEFAPTSLYPVTQDTHFLAGQMIIFKALSSGITALGEQVCGHPLCDFSIEDYRNAVEALPIDVSFATTSISIGFKQLAHFTSVTKSRAVTKSELIDSSIVQEIAGNSDYPGENIFINATPANFTATEVPRAGEVIYSFEELKHISNIYHQLGKRIGAHVAGESGIEGALEAGIDVLHHAHGITDEQIKKVAINKVEIVATPIGGTHLQPNSPENILQLVEHNIPVSISTDAYLPPFEKIPWVTFPKGTIVGPDALMLISHPAMQLLKQNGYDENTILALITLNPARLMGKEKQFGSLKAGLEANFVVAEGIPGLEIKEVDQIKAVYYKGKQVIKR